MADKNFKRNIRVEIIPKVVAFNDFFESKKSHEYVTSYLNLLCPTIEEKVAFLAVFSQTYPEKKEIIALLEQWVNASFMDYYNGEVLGKYIDRLKSVYKGATEYDMKRFGIEPESEPVTEDAGKIQEKAEEREKQTAYVNQPSSFNAKSNTFKVVRSGLFGARKGTVSSLSAEELQQAQNLKKDEKDYASKLTEEEILLERYNQRVAKRAEKSRREEQRAYKKSEEAMTIN